MKTIKVFLAALTLSVSALCLFGAPRALAATKTWTGGGSDTNMMTAGNWSGGAPSAGDDLVFPANISNHTVVNNFTAATSFNSITFSGTATQDTEYTISGNSMTLVAGITNSMTGSFFLSQTISMPLILNGNQTVDAGTKGIDLTGNVNLSSYTLTYDTDSISTMSGVISGTGGITKQGADGSLILTGNNTYSGATLISQGDIIARHQNALGTAAGGTTVSSGAAVSFVETGDSDITYTEPLTLNGDGINTFEGALTVLKNYGMGGGGSATTPTSIFSGAITLGSNIKVFAGDRNVKITGPITGNFTIGLLDQSTSGLEIASSSNGSATPNSTLAQAAKETKYESNSPSTTISVVRNETAIVTGTYGGITVNQGGTLKGTGTVGDAFIAGTLAPGMSPGCLNTGNLSLVAGSTFQVELGSTTACTGYDQVKVTGTVTVGGTLNVTLYNNFKPKAGNKFVIISNDGDATDLVSGTFDGLAQGATFKVGGYTFSISYTGGDGNDVELTVTAGAPDTGFALLTNSPIVTLAVTFGGAAGIYLISRRSLKHAPARARASRR